MVRVGDQRSFEEYVHARNAALSRIAYLLTGDHHLAEDLVQATLLRVVGRWARLVAAGDPDPYVRRVLYHLHVSWWRRRDAPVAHRGDAGEEATTPDPGDAIAVAVPVRRALAQLAPRQRAVLVLRYFEDLSEAVAGAGLEGTTGNVAERVGVMDLTSGHIDTYDGKPLTWSPDDRLLVALNSGQRKLLDPVSGTTVDAGAFGPALSVFSPDGGLLATKIGSELTIRDIAAGTEQTIGGLPDRAVLAGPGAWRSDGRVALWRSTDCAPTCPDGWAEFTLSYVDANTGGVVEAPELPPVRAEKPSLLGWHGDGDAVVALTFRMAPPRTPGLSLQWQPPTVVALHPGGGQTTLVTTPAGADRIDVARDLLDRFGAPPPSLGSRVLDVARVRAPQVLVIFAVIALIVAARPTYRRIRSGRWSGRG